MADDAIPPRAVAVVIAVRNGLPHVVEAVESALAQGDALDEVVVVDDGSSDRTFERLSDLPRDRLRVVRNAGRGVSSARNTGAAASRAPWLLFLDADDRLVPHALESLLVAREPSSVAVYGDYERIDVAGRVIGNRKILRRRRKPSGRILNDLVAGNFIINGGILICARAAFTALGGFETSLSLCEDWHLWCRLAAYGNINYVPRRILDYRVHDTSVMMASRRRFEDFEPALHAVFAHSLILSSVPSEKIEGLRRRAELSLMTYCAQQAVRAGSFADGGRMTLAAVRHLPVKAPWVLGRVVGALARM